MAGILFAFLALIFAKSPISLLAAAAFHEAGHILYAAVRRLGKPKIKALSAGIRLCYPTASSSYADSFFLCLSGPLFSLGAFFLFRGTYFSLYSLGLGAVNLLPVSCFDGGGALRDFSLLLLPYDRAIRLCRLVSVFSAVFLVFFNTLIQIKAGFNITLMAVTVYTAVTVMTDGA